MKTVMVQNRATNEDEGGANDDNYDVDKVNNEDLYITLMMMQMMVLILHRFRCWYAADGDDNKCASVGGANDTCMDGAWSGGTGDIFTDGAGEWWCW